MEVARHIQSTQSTSIVTQNIHILRRSNHVRCYLFLKFFVVEGQNSSSLNDVTVLLHVVLVHITVFNNYFFPSCRNGMFSIEPTEKTCHSLIHIHL